MNLTDAERDEKINGFLSRKFRQFGIEDNEPTVRDIRSFDALHGSL